METAKQSLQILLINRFFFDTVKAAMEVLCSFSRFFVTSRAQNSVGTASADDGRKGANQNLQIEPQ